jgi:tetratricopeptide (TPR) repeat protein
VILAVRLFRKKNIFSFLIIFYLVSILVTSNLFVLIAALMAERFLFIGSIAFCVVIAYLLTKYLGKENTYKFSPPMIAVLGPVLLAFTYMTHERNKDWFDNYTLFKAGAELDDNSFRSYSGYAWQLLDKGQKEQQDSAKRTSWYREARTYYEKAVKVYDKQQNDWFNLGVCYNYFHDTLRAENAFQKAHDINPKIVNASLNLGVIYYQKKDYEKALKYWKEGADYDPNFLTISSNVGLVYWQNFNRPDLAIPYFEKYYQSNPNDFNTVHNLCYAYKAIGNTQKSNEYFAKMQQLKPGSK